MKLKNKIRLLSRLNVFKFIFYNFISRKVVRDKKCYLFTYKGAVLDLGKGAKIKLHANYSLCANRLKGSKAEAQILIREGGELNIEGYVAQTYGATVQVHKDAKLFIGQAFINVGAVIISGKELHIGQGCLISRNVYIYDADHHNIINSDGNITNEPKITFIGNHVWLGIGVKVLRGSKIGDGAVVAAGSVVMGKVKEKTMALGYPARSFSSVIWEQ